MYKMAGRGVLSAKNVRDHTNNYMYTNTQKSLQNLCQLAKERIIRLNIYIIYTQCIYTSSPSCNPKPRVTMNISAKFNDIRKYEVDVRRWVSEISRYCVIVEKQIVWQNLMSVSTHPRIELSKKLPIYSLFKLWNELDDIRFQHWTNF
jgi:hypothetical protein